MALENKAISDLKQEKATLVSHMENKEGSVNELASKVSTLTEQLHSQERRSLELDNEV